MPNRPEKHRPPGARPTRKPAQATACQRGYDRRWRTARDAYLLEHRLCAECLTLGQQVEATAVGHVRQPGGDAGLFWDEANWVALCRRHQSSRAARERGARPE